MKIGIIGLGNMGGAILGGIVEKGIVKKEEIYGYDINDTLKNKIKDNYGINIASGNEETINDADAVILAVKPQFMADMLEGLKDKWNSNTVIISIAAGKSLEWLGEHVGADKKIVRCMPNTPALIGEGCTGMCTNGNVNDDDLKLAMKLLESCGKVIDVTEKHLSHFK